MSNVSRPDFTGQPIYGGMGVQGSMGRSAIGNCSYSMQISVTISPWGFRAYSR